MKFIIKNILISYIPLVFLINTISIAQATEVDHFTFFNKQLNDSTHYVEDFVNQAIEESVLEYNIENHKHCSKKRFIKILSKKVSFPIFGKLEMFIERHPLMDKIKVEVNDSVYKYFNVIESMPMKLTWLAQLIKVENKLIGSDKFGHFFTEGLSYYQKFQKNNHNLLDTLELGHDLENTIMGLTLTGVKSFADLVTNFQGLVFWLDLFGDTSGIQMYLKERENIQYINCKNGLMEQIRQFRWATYIDDGWDESINCNSYLTQSMHKKVKRSLDDLSNLHSMSFSCPMDLKKFYQLEKKYQYLSRYLLNYSFLKQRTYLRGDEF